MSWFSETSSHFFHWNCPCCSRKNHQLKHLRGWISTYTERGTESHQLVYQCNVNHLNFINVEMPFVYTCFIVGLLVYPPVVTQSLENTRRFSVSFLLKTSFRVDFQLPPLITGRYLYSHVYHRYLKRSQPGPRLLECLAASFGSDGDGRWHRWHNWHRTPMSSAEVNDQDSGTLGTKSVFP